ncbi:MAG: alpha-D-glucose phosphate-specific phosphoglucomutase, partial [Alphaproteobacteria bacterium]|nr:alpha-D-glucose phosphate-specific phosphoglucomutase [Alphaproteobacteria bacterium]
MRRPGSWVPCSSALSGLWVVTPGSSSASPSSSPQWGRRGPSAGSRPPSPDDPRAGCGPRPHLRSPNGARRARARWARVHERRREPRLPIAVHAVTPFDDQKPGTSGLRKSTRRFREPGYLPAYVQAILDGDPPAPGATLIVGGDGRFFGREAAETVIRMAAAAGYARVRVGQGALLSTPAASHLVRMGGAQGAVILSASHNPGGPDGDFGVKYNTASGGPAPEALTEAVFARSKALTEWRVETAGALDLDRLGEVRIGDCIVEVIDPVADYADLMESLFDFPGIRRLLASGFRMRFDAMHAVTGPYATELFERRLGAPKGTVINATPLPDFGGGHPDPHPDHAPELMAAMTGPDALDFGAASDGDGDRNMIVGPGGFVVSPGDSLAILTALADRVPAYAGGVAGVARSMPTA